MVLKLLILTTLANAQIKESEIATMPVWDPSVRYATALPSCADKAQISEIMQHVSVNAGKKAELRYAELKRAVTMDNDVQMLARLIYAETLAANCDQSRKDVLALIARVIGNRVVRRNGDVRSVVFQSGQFDNYKDSRYADFLCPEDKALWAMAEGAATGILRNLKLPREKTESVNYYLYKHDQDAQHAPPEFTKKKENEDTTGSSPKLRECIRVFKDPKWN